MWKRGRVGRARIVEFPVNVFIYQEIYLNRSNKSCINTCSVLVLPEKYPAHKLELKSNSRV